MFTFTVNIQALTKKKKSIHIKNVQKQTLQAADEQLHTQYSHKKRRMDT